MLGAIDDCACGGCEGHIIRDGSVMEPGVGEKGVHVKAGCAGLGSRG